MARPLDICIRGGGVVGLSLALLLSRCRLRVGLVPAARPDAAAQGPDVRAYALNADSRDLLESLRCWPKPDSACPVAAMQVFGDANGEVRFDAAEQGAPALAWIVDAAALLEQLGQAVGFAPEIEILTSAQPATLQVICEGGASASRAHFGVELASAAYPQRAIAARLSCDKPHQQVAYQWFAQGEILGILPMGAADGNSVAIVWSVTHDHAQALLDASEDDFVRELRLASRDQLGAFRLTSERCAWPLKLARAQRWTGQSDGQSWALAGDAAHMLHPLAGQGLNLGLADARELARVLGQREYWRAVNDERLLRRYERARKADVMAMGLVTDGLQQLFSREGGAWQAGRNWGMRGFERSGPLKHWMARRAMGAVAVAGRLVGPR